jgi:hypothetical protein
MMQQCTNPKALAIAMAVPECLGVHQQCFKKSFNAGKAAANRGCGLHQCQDDMR